jgi:hypothetical protein
MIVLLATLLAAPAVDVDTQVKSFPGSLSYGINHEITAGTAPRQKARTPKTQGQVV